MSDDDHSFDPRTWGRGKPADEPTAKPSVNVTRTANAGDAPSFDPRTWSGDAGAAESVVPPPVAEGTKPTEVPTATFEQEPTTKRTKPASALLGGAAVIALLVAGGVAAMLARPRAQPSPESPVVSAAPATLTASPLNTKQSRRTLVLAKAADLRDALADAGLAKPEAEAAAAAALKVIGSRKGEVRAVLTLTSDMNIQHLARLEASFEDSSGVVLTRAADGAFTAASVNASLSAKMTVVRGEMDANSFYTSAVAAGVTDSLIPEFARAFAFDFDFQREIKPGDVFEAAFEQPTNAAGQPVGSPRLLYASMTTEAKSRALYWFAPPGEEGGWFDGNGASIIRALMRTPVDGARVSSQFGFRVHPVLGYQKLHEGTDFAAPIGTPIFAAGDGIVQWAAMKGPNGNLTILRHDNGWLTYYLHQSAFMPGIVEGARVRQGQEIGLVGTTGRSTGPHLHYGLKIDGAFVDAMSIKTEGGRTLAGNARAAFIQERDRIDVARAAQSQ